jgi:hypothetical protein
MKVWRRTVEMRHSVDNNCMNEDNILRTEKMLQICIILTMFWRQLHFCAMNKGCLLCVLQWLCFKRYLCLRCVIKRIGFRSCVWPTGIIGNNSSTNVQLFTHLLPHSNSPTITSNTLTVFRLLAAEVLMCKKLHTNQTYKKTTTIETYFIRLKLQWRYNYHD